MALRGQTYPYAPECVEGELSEVRRGSRKDGSFGGYARPPARPCYGLMLRPVLGERNEEGPTTLHYRRSDGMYARVTTIEGSPDRIDNAKRHLQEQALPQLRQMEGFEGFVALGDRQSGKLLGVALWESEEALLAMEQAVSGVRGGAAKAAGGTLAGGGD